MMNSVLKRTTCHFHLKCLGTHPLHFVVIDPGLQVETNRTVLLAANTVDCLGLSDTRRITNMLHSECDRTVLSAALALETRT